MKKENGMVGRTTKETSSKQENKKFHCPKCDKDIEVAKVVFGEEEVCRFCGSTLVEY